MGSKCNHTCFYKEVEGNLTDRKGEGNMTTEADAGMMWPEVEEECLEAPEAKEERIRFSPRASRQCSFTSTWFSK